MTADRRAEQKRVSEALDNHGRAVDRRAEAERIERELAEHVLPDADRVLVDSEFHRIIERALIAERNATLEEAARAVESDARNWDGDARRALLGRVREIRALRTDAGTDAGEETGT